MYEEQLMQKSLSNNAAGLLVIVTSPHGQLEQIAKYEWENVLP